MHTVQFTSQPLTYNYALYLFSFKIWKWRDLESTIRIQDCWEIEMKKWFLHEIFIYFSVQWEWARVWNLHLQQLCYLRLFHFYFLFLPRRLLSRRFEFAVFLFTAFFSMQAFCFTANKRVLDLDLVVTFPNELFV